MVRRQAPCPHCGTHELYPVRKKNGFSSVSILDKVECLQCSHTMSILKWMLWEEVCIIEQERKGCSP